MMRFSIVIPTYNEESSIGKCINAIKNGVEQPDEIIVVDGLSTDATRNIAKTMGARV